MSTPPPTSPTYVNIEVKQLIDTINYARATDGTITGNDISGLSALSYLSFSFPLSIGSYTTAFDYVSKPSSTAPSVNTEIYNCVTGVLLNGAKSLFNFEYKNNYNYKKLLYDSGAVDPAALTIPNLTEAFFQVGATVFLGLLCKRINESSNNGYVTISGNTRTPITVTPETPVNPLVSTSMQGPTFKDVIELSRYQLSLMLGAKMESVNENKVKVRLNTLKIPPTALKGLDKEDEGTMPERAVMHILSVLRLTSGIFDKDTVDLLVKIGLLPWMMMTKTTKYQGDPEASFVTQAYSRIASFYLVMVAFAKLDVAAQQNSAGGGGTGANAQNQIMQNVINKINTNLTDSFEQTENSGPIAHMLNLSAKNNSTAEDLSIKSKSLKDRVGIASDLQTTLNFESKNVRYAKFTFYAWLVAFIIVFVTSIVLILNDKISVFLPMAYGILLLIVVVWFLSWAVARYRMSIQSYD